MGHRPVTPYPPRTYANLGKFPRKVLDPMGRIVFSTYIETSDKP